MAYSASSQCLLANVKSGQRITISAISACGSTGTIVLKDDSTTYATLSKTSEGHQYQYLGNSSDKYTGGKNLRVEINIRHSSYQISIKQIVNNTNLVDDNGKIVGSVYTIAVEDYDDYDYNDFIITITVTNK